MSRHWAVTPHSLLFWGKGSSPFNWIVNNPGKFMALLWARFLTEISTMEFGIKEWQDSAAAHGGRPLPMGGHSDRNVCNTHGDVHTLELALGVHLASNCFSRQALWRPLVQRLFLFKAVTDAQTLRKYIWIMYMYKSFSEFGEIEIL